VSAQPSAWSARRLLSLPLGGRPASRWVGSTQDGGALVPAARFFEPAAQSGRHAPGLLLAGLVLARVRSVEPRHGCTRALCWSPGHGTCLLVLRCAVAVATGGAFALGSEHGQQATAMSLGRAELAGEYGSRDGPACGAVLFVDLSCSGLQVHLGSGHGRLAVHLGACRVRPAAGYAKRCVWCRSGVVRPRSGCPVCVGGHSGCRVCGKRMWVRVHPGGRHGAGGWSGPVCR
jgi:hypothetical protein